MSIGHYLIEGIMKKDFLEELKAKKMKKWVASNNQVFVACVAWTMKTQLNETVPRMQKFFMGIALKNECQGIFSSYLPIKLPLGLVQRGVWRFWDFPYSW